MNSLTVGEAARRSGFATSALRFYEREGLLSAERTEGGSVVIRAACFVGLPSSEQLATWA